MRKITFNIILLSIIQVYSLGSNGYSLSLYSSFNIQQVSLDGNNVNSWILNTGTFDQNRYSETPGFEWPILTGQQMALSAGLTLSAYYNGTIRMAAASHNGEYVPGHIIDSAGIPVARTDTIFKLYKVKRGDNRFNNPDWLNWGFMVPYGAPFIDVNHDGIYEPDIDTPGIKGASQTIFLCMTDGFPWSHTPNEGFGGGTQPLYAEVHMVAWCYDEMPLNDAQLIKWDVINKSHTPWNGAYFSIIGNPCIGCPLDDKLGTDSTRDLAYCYNLEEVDCADPNRYSGLVPAVGFLWLNCPNYRNTSKLNSIVYYSSSTSNAPPCDLEPGSDVLKAYNFFRGYKNDGTPFVIPNTNPPVVTRYCYNSDPETGSGWVSNMRVGNCGGLLTGSNYIPDDSSCKFVMSSGADNLVINPGDTHTVTIAQFAARGANRRNSVTILKTISSYIKSAACNDFVLGLNHTTETMFGSIFTVYPNYPNPFNPKTVIKYELSKSDFLILTVYDVLGKVVATLVKGVQQPGSYRVEWDGYNYPSGVYFYKLSAGAYEQTRKMVMIK